MAPDGYQNAIFLWFGAHLRLNYIRLQVFFDCAVVDKLKFWVPNGTIQGDLVPILGRFLNFRLQKLLLHPAFCIFLIASLAPAVLRCECSPFVYVVTAYVT